MNEDTVERIVRCIIQNEGGYRLALSSPLLLDFLLL